MNVKAISINIGKALLINALFMFIAACISAFNGFDSAFTPLLISFLVTLITGLFPFIFVKEKAYRITSVRIPYHHTVLDSLIHFRNAALRALGR